MKVIIFLLTLMICLSQAKSNSLHSKPLAAYKKADTWYFIDNSGKEMFSSDRIFDVIGYSEGFYRVRMNDTMPNQYWAFIKDNGEMAFKPNSAIIYDIKDGMALSIRNNPWSKSLQIFGYYNKFGNEAIPHIYDDATDFSEGFAYVFNDSVSGFIDKYGKIVIPLPEKAGNPFSEGLSSINNKEFKVGIINKTGEQLVDFLFDEIHPFSEGKAAFHLHGRFGYLDTSGIILVRPLYDFANPFKENYAFVGIAEDNYYTAKWGFIDTTGKLVSNMNYQEVSNFSEGLAAVKFENKWGFIDYHDKFILPNIYSIAFPFVDGLAFVGIADENRYGFIDKSGNWVITIEDAIKVVDVRINKRVK